MELKQVQLSDSLEDIARVGVIVFRHVSNGPMSTSLRQQIDDFATELRRSMVDRRPSELDTVAHHRLSPCWNIIKSRRNVDSVDLPSWGILLN